ncbi:hypothetical protein CsSME_00041362 [Camellia sinensis var. sinensis]
MDDFGMLARDFGFRPQGKSVPMAPSKSNVGGGSDGVDRRTQSSSPFNDVFGGPPKYSSANNAKSASSLSDFDYGSIFKSSSTSANDLKNRSSSPVYDKPVYDEDIFDGLPGVKSKSMSAKVRFDDHVFTSTSSPPYQNQNQNQNQSAAFDDLLGNLGRTDKPEPKNSKSSRGFDDLMSAFGDGSHSISSRHSLRL